MKLIINNTSTSGDLRALRLVHQVIEDGLVSDFGKSYRYLTTYEDKVTGEAIAVTCNRNKSGSFAFNVYNNTP